MGNEIKTFLFGEKCFKCEELGVHCVQSGVFTFGVPVKDGQTLVYIDGRAAVKTDYGIDECSVVKGENTVIKVVSELRKRIELLLIESK